MKIPIVETLDITDANPESRLVGMTPNELKERGFPVSILRYKPFWSVYTFVFDDLINEMKNEKISNILVDRELGKIIILGDMDSSQELGELQDKKFE